MPKPIIKIVNATTGEEIEREMNDAEFARYQEKNQQFEILKAEQNAKIAARQSALDKLAALGLTADEVSALIP
jgi:hypothetical protein